MGTYMVQQTGDPLPRQQGGDPRPRSHADPWGTLVIPLVMIFANPVFNNWMGKPVQVSLPNLKTRKRDDI